MADVIRFVEEVTNISGAHMNNLKNEYGFPNECVLSSHLLAGYLEEKFDVKIVYGTYGNHKLFHCWIEYGEIILDFTLFQFLTGKQNQEFYVEKTAEEMLGYVLKHQESYFIYPSDDNYGKYHPITYVPSSFQDAYTKNQSYTDFIRRCKEKAIYEGLSWFYTKDVNNVLFHELLEEKGLRVGRKFFGRKWAICKQVV